MNRSKIFLGATTCLLAVVGVAATKAHKFTTKKFGYFGTHGGAAPTCNRISGHQWYTANTAGIDVAQTKFNSHLYNVYTKSSASTACSGNTLFTAPGGTD